MTVDIYYKTATLINCAYGNTKKTDIQTVGMPSKSVPYTKHGTASFIEYTPSNAIEIGVSQTSFIQEKVSVSSENLVFKISFY